jgi:transposase
MYYITMPTITRRTIKGHTYYYAVECQRVHGKPRLVMQKYLGSAHDILQAVEGSRKPVEPNSIRVFSFGGVAAAWSMAQRLHLIDLIDRHAPKRHQGLSVGRYITLAAINRCVAPKSKRTFAQWYATTSLSRLCPVPTRLLTSQRFWDHMQRLDLDAIRRIESDLTQHLLNEFHLDLRCLAYDTTNFFTFIDTFNEKNTIARRGKSKQHRADLRIVGLAMLVSMDFHVPLFHQTYPGNRHDSKMFASITEELVERYRLLSHHCQEITLVFDKGNNSAANFQTLDASPYHFVGSLPYNQHSELLDIPRKQFRPLSHPRLEGVEVYRTRKPVMGVERTVLVTYNENLFLAQLQTILAELRKRKAKLHELQTQLRRRVQGQIRRGKGPTAAGVQNQVATILKGQHMKHLIQTWITEEEGLVTLTYRCDRPALEKLSRRVLGKTILFTDNDEWTDEEIVLAYRGQSQIENAFRTMKNPHFISLRPMYHWTDPMIQIHAFYCVLALTVASLLVRELHHKGIEISIPHLFNQLNSIYEVALIWPRRSGRPSAQTPQQPRDTLKLPDLTPDQQQILDALDLGPYLPAVV